MICKICINKQADHGKVWVMKFYEPDRYEYDLIQLPPENIPDDGCHTVVTCSQGDCRDPAIILDHHYPYYDDCNYCAKCAKARDDSRRKDLMLCNTEK